MATALARYGHHGHHAHHEGFMSRWMHGNPILSRSRSLFGGSSQARAIESGHILRQGAESLVVGGLLGLIHVEAPRGGLDQMDGRMPIDGLVAGLGLVGSWATAGHPSSVSSDLRNAGSVALGIFSFRKLFAFAAERKLHSGGHVGGSFGPAMAGHPRPLGMHPAAHHGDISADPIVRAARGL